MFQKGDKKSLYKGIEQAKRSKSLDDIIWRETHLRQDTEVKTTTLSIMDCKAG